MTFEQKYNVLGTRDKSYDGIFFTAVKTTGIFCHPSCRARVPKSKNVFFYSSIQNALENGFRPCKICKPLENIGETPLYIKELVSELGQYPHVKISDAVLKQKGIEPHTIRRWFKKNYGFTFHAFQRMLRINYAFNQIKKGKSISYSAFESGYESLSGFNKSYQSIFGKSASNSKDKNVVNIIRFSSPIGSLIACATDVGICYLGFIGQEKFETHMEEILKCNNAIMLPGINVHLEQLQKELSAYFIGDMKEFSVKLDMVGTEFRKSVWNQLKGIPYGDIITYRNQAISMNNIKAIRAIASANGENKISIIIPCHRVIGSNGKLTGYAGGLHKKKWLLDFERKNSQQSFQSVLDL